MCILCQQTSPKRWIEKHEYDVMLWRHKQRTPNTNDHHMPLNENHPHENFLRTPLCTTVPKQRFSMISWEIVFVIFPFHSSQYRDNKDKFVSTKIDFVKSDGKHSLNPSAEVKALHPEVYLFQKFQIFPVTISTMAIKSQKCVRWVANGIDQLWHFDRHFGLDISTNLKFVNSFVNCWQHLHTRNSGIVSFYPASFAHRHRFTFPDEISVLAFEWSFAE